MVGNLGKSHADARISDHSAWAMRGRWREAYVALRTDIAREVKVKPLIWVRRYKYENTECAKSIMGEWSIWEINGQSYMASPSDIAGRRVGQRLEEARAASQDAYEASIRAALKGFEQ